MESNQRLCPNCFGTKEVIKEEELSECIMCDDNGNVHHLNHSAFINEVLPVLT